MVRTLQDLGFLVSAAKSISTEIDEAKGKRGDWVKAGSLKGKSVRPAAGSEAITKINPRWPRWLV